MVTLCFRHEEQKEKPQLGQPCSLLNREKLLVQFEQDMMYYMYRNTIQSI